MPTKPWVPIGVTDPGHRRHRPGQQAKKAQRLLAKNKFRSFGPGPADGVLGPLFERAVIEAKWELGYPGKRRNLKPIFGVRLYLYLSGQSKLPLAFRARRRIRRRRKNSEQAVRRRMVQWCRWGIAHQDQIHYTQDRPIPIEMKPGHLPITTDCSGSSIMFAKWSGVKTDPGGYGYSGAGSSASIAAHQKPLPKSAVQPGDFACWPGHHVAVVIEPGADPLLASHGQESGPDAIRLSAEADYHRRHGHGEPRFFSLLEPIH